VVVAKFRENTPPKHEREVDKMRGWIAITAVLVLMLACSIPSSYGHLKMPDNEVEVTVYSIPGQLQIWGIPSGFFVLWGVPTQYIVGVGSFGGPAWCADSHTLIAPGTRYTAHLYSSYDPNMPACAKNGKDWNRINYIINIAPVRTYEGRFATIQEEQDAVWYFTDNSTMKATPSTPIVQAMIRDAIANGTGYHPVSESDEAVIVFISCNVQIIFTQFRPGMEIPPTIVPQPTLPPPAITIMPPPVTPPVIFTPVPTPIPTPSIPAPVAVGGAVAGLLATLGADAAKSCTQEKEKEPEPEKPEEEPIPIPVPASHTKEAGAE
jgi:hypothetical protein